MDRLVSCMALLLLGLALASGTIILLRDCIEWLRTGALHWVPLDAVLSWIRSIGSGWVGLQRIYDALLALPLAIVLYGLGIVFFGIGNVLSAALYKRAAHAQAKTITPAQVHT